MRSQLRNWDSKITFFAFADIITAVSGMLIFITLLLATDLGRPAGDSAAISNLKQQLQAALAQQATADAQNARLEELLSTAQTAPDLGKLQADIARLRSQVAEENQRQTTIAGQIAGNEAAAQTRDARLGLADFGGEVQRALHEAQSIAERDTQVHGAMDDLQRQVERFESTLLKLRQRDGQIWLIPDKSTTTKEPILVTVSGTAAVIERFDHPEQRRQSGASVANAAFKSYLHQAKASDQYVVFLLRPSGIALFQELVSTARGMGFEVGYDAMEEDRQIHFSTPPALDDRPLAGPPAVVTDQNASATSGKFAAAGKAAAVEPSATESKPQPPSAPATAKPPPPKKSWWQRLLEWLGLA